MSCLTCLAGSVNGRRKARRRLNSASPPLIYHTPVRSSKSSNGSSVRFDPPPVAAHWGRRFHRRLSLAFQDVYDPPGEESIVTGLTGTLTASRLPTDRLDVIIKSIGRRNHRVLTRAKSVCILIHRVLSRMRQSNQPRRQLTPANVL